MIDQINAAETTIPVVQDFHLIRDAVNASFITLTDNQKLFKTNVPKGALFDAYLAAIPEAQRQKYNCTCCRSFLNRYGSLVLVSTEEGKEGVVQTTLWNTEQLGYSADPFFLPAIEAMKAIVEKAVVKGIFVSDHETLGEGFKDGFNHFAVDNLNVYTSAFKKPGEVVSAAEQDYGLLAKFVGKVDLALLTNVQTYFKHDQVLSRIEDQIDVIDWAIAFKQHCDAIKDQTARKNFIWSAVATERKGRLRVGKGVIGTFLKNLDKGDDYSAAKAKFLDMVKEGNYMIPKAPPAEGNKVRAEDMIKKMGLSSALLHRPAMESDLNRPEMVLWKPTVKEVKPVEDAPVFGHVKTKTTTAKTVPSLPIIKGGVITLERFMVEVLPTATELYVLINSYDRYDFCGVTQVVDPTSKPLLLWDRPEQRNTLSAYTYAGGSPANRWKLTPGLIKVKQILVSPPEWDAPDAKEKSDLVWQLEGANDWSLNFTPMNATSTIRDLYEVRATLQAYFQSTPMQKLEEGQTPVAGMYVSRAKGAGLGITLQVLKDDVQVLYVIDRVN